MVSFRVLERDEKDDAFPKRGHVDLNEYLDALRDLSIGDAAEVEPNGLTRRALKRRIGMAAKQLGATIKWARTDDREPMVFEVRGSSTAKARKPRQTAESKRA